MRTRRKGHPSKLTRELIARVARHVSTGAQIDEAAAAVGVSRASLQQWMQKGRTPGDSLERLLVEAVDQAQGAHAVACHRTLSRAAKKEWKAADASLVRSNQSRYGQGRIEFSVSIQLQAAIGKLREEFAHEPATFERILACLAGESREFGASSLAPSASGLAGAEERAVDPASTDGSPVGIPRPQL